MSDSQKLIPVTIISGFLGAGKTSFLNELIKGNKNTKFAILENEFGEIGIDSDLVVSGKEGVYELTNGCICCSLNRELVETLHKLLESDYSFDHLIIETTGVADPSGVIEPFLTYPVLKRHFKLDAVIGIADAANIEVELTETEEAIQQLTAAQVLFLNKTENIEAAEIARLEELLLKVNPLAKVVIGAYGLSDEMGTNEFIQLQAYSYPEIERAMEGVEGHHHHHHHIATHSFTFTEPLDEVKFRQWMNILLMVQGANVYRVKGVLNIAEIPNKVVFQSVRTQGVFTVGKPWEEGEERVSKLVFIGKKLEEKYLLKNINNSKC